MRISMLPLIVILLLSGMTNAELPNIVFILADDLGYGDVGCYNEQCKVKTPNIDQLAADGMRFTDAHSPSTVCTPTRYSVMTGRMAFRLNYRGVFTGAGGPCLIEESRLTLPGMLKQHGYTTACFGKWHIGLTFFDRDGNAINQNGLDAVRRIDYSRAIPDSPIHRGFDHFFGTACCPTTDWLYAWIDGDRIPNPPTAIVDRTPLPKHDYSHDNRPGMIADDFDLEEVDLVFLEKSKQFLRSHVKESPNKPFFLFHSCQAVHLPSFSADRFKGKTDAGPHGDFIHELDFIVGDLMKTLDELGVADSTLVIFSSDNGPEVPTALAMRKNYDHDGARPWRGLKRDNWEGGHRVPMIARWPGKIAASSVTQQTACLTDIMATCASVVGASLPNDAAEDSFNLLPVLTGEKPENEPVREFTLHQTISLALAIRQGNLKYLDHVGSGGNRYDSGRLADLNLPDTAPDARGQLYDLENDPYETKNLYFEKPEIVADLKSQLDEFVQSGRSAPLRDAGQKPLIETKAASPDKKRPNIVYIMSDELAYYEVGYAGNELLQTPRIDQMAREGLIFTNALAGAPVCAPLRASLMTGKHMGHCSVRANDGGTPLRAGEPTVPSMLKSLGYATGGFGKWGAGGRDSTGVPEQHGFDTFFGYYDQVHAHSFYPAYLIENSAEVVLPGNAGGRSGETYSHYEIMKRGLNFIRENKDRPFFCYLPITPPHGMYDIPDSDPAWQIFKDKPGWPEDAKRYAAMVKMVDRNVGEVLDLLEELELEENTIVFFAGDNGGQDRFRTAERPRGFFGPNVNPKTGVEFRGGKGNLYEGGLRIPSIVRWPGKIKSGQTSDLIWYHPDIFPTLAELVDGQTPDDVDGISILPTILGEDAAGHAQADREMLYWEFGNQTAVRYGRWKAIRPRANAPWALYDLDEDVSETTDVSSQHADILEKVKVFAAASHVPANPGTYSNRSRHEKDRRAKWGTSGPPVSRTKTTTKWNQKGLIPRTHYSIVQVSSEASNAGKLAKATIDGDPGTWWHTDWSVDPTKHPHELVIDLGASRTVTGIRYLARQDGSQNGMIADCDLQVLKELNDKGTAEKFSHTFKKNKRIQNFRIEPTVGRYVRVLPKSEVNNKTWASVAELGVIGK
ncbi:MAG: sulfatase-like hydrolase/transferase [Planctomycetales bacterium]|nr:sulfatase-like hydrolase/transferase [Planctomycetales bacterium]